MTDLPLEVYNFRHFPNNKRCGFFKTKVYVGDRSFIELDSWKLMKDPVRGYYVLPPAEKNGEKFFDLARCDDTLRDYICEKAVALYNGYRSINGSGTN